MKTVREAALRLESEGLLSVLLLPTPRGPVLAQKKKGAAECALALKPGMECVLRLLLVDLSLFHDEIHVFENQDIGEGITCDGDDVRILAGLQGAEKIRFT
jgi:hypothetical protein